MKPISKETRELIISAKERGEKENDIATWLKIGKRTIGAIWKRYKETGNISPIPYKGRSSCLSEGKIEEIKATIKERADITLAEMIEELTLPIKKSQLSRVLNKLGFSYKKNSTPKRTAKGRRCTTTR